MTFELLLVLLFATSAAAASAYMTKFNANTDRFELVERKTGRPKQLRGLSMTGFETGTRMKPGAAGFWLFGDVQSPTATSTKATLTNLVRTLVGDVASIQPPQEAKWKANILRLPICGSAWLQDYTVTTYSGDKVASYREWIDVAVKAATTAGAQVIIDNHLWAITKQTNNSRNKGIEDGCTGALALCCRTRSTQAAFALMHMPTLVLVLVFIVVYMLLFFLFGFLFWLVETAEPGSFESSTGEDGSFWVIPVCVCVAADWL